MDEKELINRIHDLEWEDFEVKEAKSELPKNIWETVSAFANTFAWGYTYVHIYPRIRMYRHMHTYAWHSTAVSRGHPPTPHFQKDIEKPKSLSFY